MATAATLCSRMGRRGKEELGYLLLETRTGRPAHMNMKPTPKQRTLKKLVVKLGMGRSATNPQRRMTGVREKHHHISFPTKVIL